ncbi:hypothetical protein [Oceaniglobus ichthyenteri]|uniref:hypothetical protein n=1 Tax=Oceaniglobus ichthyenteri TaxID=2136177 RepID=UPI0013DE5640|nr:hypothetical protein [Oceaniglobus ichthyenteri]
MEKLVETVMRHERKSDYLDRIVLAIGALSLCLALIGTLMAGANTVAQDTAPPTLIAT